MSISDYGQREKHHHTVMSGTVKKRPDSTPGRFLDNRVQITENREQRTEYRVQGKVLVTRDSLLVACYS